MPKPSTLPTFFEDTKSISITSLKKWGYLIPNQKKNGVVSWSRNGEVYSSINIECSHFEKPILRLTYTCQQTSIDYLIELTSIKSNIGDGRIFYFICPFSGKYARKLYLFNGYFRHRSACKGTYYERQTQSKNLRDMLQIYKGNFLDDWIFDQRYKKHAKTHYKGRTTKRIKRLLFFCRGNSNLRDGLLKSLNHTSK